MRPKAKLAAAHSHWDGEVSWWDPESHFPLVAATLILLFLHRRYLTLWLFLSDCTARERQELLLWSRNSPLSASDALNFVADARDTNSHFQLHHDTNGRLIPNQLHGCQESAGYLSKVEVCCTNQGTEVTSCKFSLLAAFLVHIGWHERKPSWWKGKKAQENCRNFKAVTAWWWTIVYFTDSEGGSSDDMNNQLFLHWLRSF